MLNRRVVTEMSPEYASLCLAITASIPLLSSRAKDVQVPLVPDKETGCAA
jgi:hypothetical protein